MPSSKDIGLNPNLCGLTGPVGGQIEKIFFIFFIGGEAPNKPKDLMPNAPDKFKGPESFPIKHLVFVRIDKLVIIGLQEIITFNSNIIKCCNFISEVCNNYILSLSIEITWKMTLIYRRQLKNSTIYNHI